MVQFVCEGAEKHAVRMLEELHRMKQDQDHCDFIVQVGNDVYHAHKNVLSAGSEYFRAMLKHDTKESREGKVVFKDVDSECVKICIDFIYSSKCEIPDEKRIELLHVAIILQLERLKNAISDNLARTITIENYFSTRNAGDIYGLPYVSKQCRFFLRDYIMEFTNHAGFGSVEKDDFFSVLKSSRTTLWEEDKLELSLKWIAACQKTEYLHECLELLDFCRISPAILPRLIETHPIIRNDSKLHEFISEHFQEASVKLVKENELIILFDRVMHCMRSFNPVSKKITMFHGPKFSRWDCFSAITFDSHIYILWDNKSVYRLNFQRRDSNWEKMEDMIFEHGQSPSSVTLCGSIFVIGGSFPKLTDNAERFDPLGNRWLQLRNKPTPISDASLVSLNDSIYCVGGRAVKGPSFCRFTPSSSEWVDLEPMRYPVHSCGVVAVDQRIFAISGRRNIETLNNVECYDVTSAQWTSLPSMNFDHGYDNAYHIGNWIFVVDELGYYHDIKKYDLLNNKWYCIKIEEDQDFMISKSVVVKV